MQPLSTMHLEELKALKYAKEFTLSVLRKSDVSTDRVYLQMDTLRQDIHDIELELTQRKLQYLHSQDVLKQYLRNELGRHISHTTMEELAKNLVFRKSTLPIQITSGEYVLPKERKLGFKFRCKQAAINFIQSL